MRNKLSIASVLLAAGIGSAWAASFPAIGATVHLKYGIACKNYNDWKTLAIMVGANRQKAFIEYAGGHCTFFRNNPVFRVVKVDRPTLGVCVRPERESGCYWTGASSVTR